MKSPSQLKPGTTPLFLDTSVVINLVASRRIEEVRRVLNRPLVVEEAVMLEMKRNPRDQGDGVVLMPKLTGDGVLGLHRLDEVQSEHFFRLVAAPVPDDLGDGEAATIAASIGLGAVVLDDRKARRILRRDFPGLGGYCSLDLLCAEPVFAALGPPGVADAVRAALRDGRMRVPLDWRPFVDQMVGKSNEAVAPLT